MTTKLIRLTVNLNRQTAEALAEIAERRSMSMTEAVRRGISVLKFVYDQEAAGRKIITMNPDGSNKQEMVMM